MSRFFPRSLRWRLQLWLAFLLVCVLAGFGVTVYQLQRVNRLGAIDGELETRIAALTGAVRELSGPPGRRGPPPDDFGFDGGGPPPDGKDKPPERRLQPGMAAPQERQRGLGQQGGQERQGRAQQGGRGEGQEGGRVLKEGVGEGDFKGRGFGPPPERRPKAEDLKVPGALFADYYYVVWYRDGSVMKASAGAPEGLARPEPSERDTLPHFRTRLQYREALHCSGLGDCVLAGRSVEADLAALRNFAWALLAAGGAVLALGLGLGFWFTARAIRPIENISAAASRISHGNLSERVEGAGSGDELGNLAEVLNSTFARLEAAFLRQRQFTADAAHELRTPLAVIISEAQTTLARERAAADYRETVEACLETAQQMRRLTESLLELARFDGREDHARGEVDVAEAARAGVERIRPLADKHGIAIESALAPAQAWGNAERIGQVITNLLANAIYYNKAAGKVRVVTESFRDRVEITVSDTGVGIAAEDLAHIFDRFYRVDKARSRAEGHVGLGLAISKSMVEGEGGTIEVASVLGEGSRFTVVLKKET